MSICHLGKKNKRYRRWLVPSRKEKEKKKGYNLVSVIGVLARAYKILSAAYNKHFRRENGLRIRFQGEDNPLVDK